MGVMHAPEIRVVADGAALARAAADLVVTTARQAVARTGRFAIALSGGSTPKALYGLLATDATLRREMPWAQTHFFFGDERRVPPEHADSNYRMAREAMFAPAGVAAANIHRICGEDPDASRAAQAYEADLRAFFGAATKGPCFDLVLLGMGADTHTASLFPNTPALGETVRWVVANPVAKLGTERITLTAPAINRAALVAFIVGGADKAEPLSTVLYGPRDMDAHPAQLIAPVDGHLVWLIDAAAATWLGSR